MYGIKEGVRNSLVIADIDLINEVFVKQFDAFYARPVSHFFRLPTNPEILPRRIRSDKTWTTIRECTSSSRGVNLFPKMFKKKSSLFNKTVQI